MNMMAFGMKDVAMMAEGWMIVLSPVLMLGGFVMLGGACVLGIQALSRVVSRIWGTDVGNAFRDFLLFEDDLKKSDDVQQQVYQAKNPRIIQNAMGFEYCPVTHVDMKHHAPTDLPKPDKATDAAAPKTMDPNLLKQAVDRASGNSNG